MQNLNPFPYQQQLALELSKRKRVLFAGDMGIGKTCIASTAANLAGCSKILIICPAVLQTNWQTETGPDMWMVLADITVVSFNKASQEATHRELYKTDWDLLIVDEAHYLKNPKSKRTEAIYGQFGLARRAKRLWLLSGTFMPNDASELWTHLNAVIPNLVNFYKFREYFCQLEVRTVGRRGARRRVEKVIGNRNVPELQSILNEVALRCKAKDVLPDLPELHYVTVPIKGKIPARVEEIDNELVTGMVDIQRCMQAGDLDSARRFLSSLKLDQVSRALRYLAIKKAQSTLDYIKELLNSTEKLVVFGKHIDALDIISNGLTSSGILNVKIDGSTSDLKRNTAIHQFQNQKARPGEPTPRVFIAQIDACGVGVTLTKANHVVFAELSWVPAANIQAAKRCHRIGQNSTVFCHVLMIPNSLDEQVQRTIIQKQTMIDQHNL